jgi:apolipoprotein N-acyltransferase
VFRAVEARVGIARSTNAGVTAFVSPSGEVYAVAGGPGAAAMPRDERALRQGANAVAVTRRVRLDRRRSIYVATRGLTDDALLGLWWCALAWSLWSAGRRRRSPGLLRSPLTW